MTCDSKHVVSIVDEERFGQNVSGNAVLQCRGELWNGAEGYDGGQFDRSNKALKIIRWLRL
jgi:hypothetical protein